MSDEARAPAPCLPTSRKEWVWLLGLMGLAVLWRLAFLVWTRFDFEADEAVIGLMARHIALGQAAPIWYYGQSYMGAVEAYAAVPLIWLLGPTGLAIKMTALAFSILYVGTGWALARRVLGSTMASWFTLVYLAVPPLCLTLWSVKLRGGYVSVMALGQAVLVLAHVIGTQGMTPRRAFVLGLLAGFGLWWNPLVAPYVVAAGLYLLSRRQLIAGRQPLLVGLAGLTAGSTLLWLDILVNPADPFRALLGDEQMAVGHHLAIAFGRHLPILLGELPPWQTDSSVSATGLIVTVFFSISVGTFLWIQRRSLWRFVSGSRQPTSGAEMLVVVALGILAASALTRFGGDPSPRYALVLYTLLIPAVGTTLGWIWSQARTARVASLASMVLLVAYNAISIYGYDRDLPTQPTHYVRDGLRIPADRREVYRYLDKEGIDLVAADYWIGQLVSFETGERTIAVTRPLRVPSHLERIERSHLRAWLYLDQGRQRADAQRRCREIESSGLQPQTRKVGGLLVVTIKDEGLAPDLWHAWASSGPHPEWAFDRNEATRWTSVENQRPGQWLLIDMGRETTLVGVGFVFGEEREPIVLSVSRSLDGEEYELIQRVSPGSHWHFRQAPFVTRFLLLEQSGSRQEPWTIHELYALTE